MSHEEKEKRNTKIKGFLPFPGRIPNKWVGVSRNVDLKTKKKDNYFWTQEKKLTIASKMYFIAPWTQRIDFETTPSE